MTLFPTTLTSVTRLPAAIDMVTPDDWSAKLTVDLRVTFSGSWSSVNVAGSMLGTSLDGFLNVSGKIELMTVEGRLRVTVARILGSAT